MPARSGGCAYVVHAEKYFRYASILTDERISFFNRVKVFDRETGERILPVHYSDNYVTLMPGDERTIRLEFVSELPRERVRIVVDSWTSERMEVN